MLKKKIDGEVLLSFIVTKNGAVRNVRVLRSTDASFASAAKEAAQDWKYRPAQLRGQVVECRMHVPVTFIANPESE